MNEQEEKLNQQEETANEEILEEENQNQETNEQAADGEACAEVPPEQKEEKKDEPSQPTADELLNALNDKYLRLRADFDNYMKRMAREANDIRERSKKSVVTEFLPVYDFFQMAMKHSETSDDIAALRQGMNMILNEFSKAFDALGVKELQAVGQKFDPNLHEAVKSEPSDTVAEGIIIQQWKPGYMMGDKLLRAAMVVVSSGPAEKATEKEQK